MPSRTLYGRSIYTNGVGITLSVYNQGCGRPRIANRQKPDTPLFFCSHQYNNLTSPILGVWRTILQSVKKILSGSQTIAKSKYFWLYTFSLANLFFMHYCFYFSGYLEWSFLYSCAANSFSVYFDSVLVLSLCLFITRRRLKPALALTFVVTLIWSFVNVVYSRFFYTYLPLSAFSEITSLKDGIVVNNVLRGFKYSYLYFFISTFSFTWLYRNTSSKHISKERFINITVFILLALVMTFLSYSIYHFVHPKYRSNWEMYVRRIKELTFCVNDGGTPILSRFQAGSVRTILYEIYDELTPKELTPEERKEVESFYWDVTGKITTNKTPNVQNVFFILLESFLSSPIDMVVGGKEITPFLNSLRKDSTVYYNGKMKSDITCGESGDGQFLYMTGILPLRHTMTVSKLSNKKLPALPRLLKEKFGIKRTEIIIPTQPNMWQQSDANLAYGIDYMYSFNDISLFSSSDKVTDETIFRFAANVTNFGKEPVFSMILSVSTHSPYSDFCGEDILKDNTNFTAEYRNYLNTCHYTDKWLEYYIKELKSKGIYNRSLIVICADHYAHLDRLKMQEKISNHTPLFIINAGFDKKTAWNNEFHQLDVFTSILDILNLDSSWKGLGHTILDSTYHESVNDKSYSVSLKLMESNYFAR